jgi:hypothetical protein
MECGVDSRKLLGDSVGRPTDGRTKIFQSSNSKERRFSIYRFPLSLSVYCFPGLGFLIKTDP